MQRQHAARQSLSHALILFAVLAGLFLMHGLGNPATGCHTAPSDAAMSPMHATAEHPVHALPGSRLVVAAAERSSWTSGDCVATFPRAAGPVALVLLAMVGLAADPARTLQRSWSRRETRWRGPPLAGIRLLHMVCICRT